MKPGRKRFGALALTMSGIGLVGSVGYAAAPVQRQSAGDAAAGASADAVPAPQSRLSASAAKPVAPISIEYEFSTQPRLGTPFEVQISTASRGGIGELGLTVHPDDGLAAGTPQLTTDASDSARRSWTVAATAFLEGTLYLSVLVQGTVGDQHPSRNLVIPIRIGATAGAPPIPQSTARPLGERVIVLPSERAP